MLDAWTPLGPGNIGGRTRVVKFHPTVPTTIFAAGVSGGIWKSDDNATTWRPTGDGLTNIAVNSLLIDPARPDVMYAGTGEGYFREEIRGTGLPLRGSGIYVTTDGARSWQQLPATNTPDFHWVNDLEFGVNDSRRIYAATRSGVWRSTDSGATWARLLGGQRARRLPRSRAAARSIRRRVVRIVRIVRTSHRVSLSSRRRSIRRGGRVA